MTIMDISSKSTFSIPPSCLPEGFQIKNLDLDLPRKEEQDEVLQIKKLDLLYAPPGATEKLDKGEVYRNDETEKTHGSSSSLGGDDMNTCTSSSSFCSTNSEHKDRFDDNMDDDDDDDDEEDDAFNDDDSCSSLDGMIPSMASQSLVDNTSSSSGPTIHFMGRDFSVDELSLGLSQSSQKVIQDSSVFNRRSSRRSRRANSMSMSCQEHLSDRWAGLEQAQQPQASSTTTRKSSRRNRRSSMTSVKQSEDSMDNSMVASLRRASTATISSLSRRVSTSTASSSPSMASESETFGSARRSSALPVSPMRTKPKMSSQSEHFGSSRRSSAATPTGYLSSLVGKVNITLGFETAAEAAAAAKDQRWKDQLDQWGYSNHDVLCVVQDDHVFKKLQRDLREHKAVTNGTIRQKIHVFVHNTRTKQLQHQLKQERRREKRQHRKQLSSSQNGSDHSASKRRQQSPHRERVSQSQS